MKKFLAALLSLAFILPMPPGAGAQGAPPPGLIAFSGPFGLWTIDGNGRGEQLLNTGPNADMPSYSPDGRRIVYSIAGTPETGAWIYDTNNGARTQLSRDPWRWPSWSPDGRKIAFTLPRAGGSDVYVMDLDTRIAHAITFEGINEAPSWWGDSQKLLFSRNGELWVSRIDGAEAGAMRGTVGTTVLQAAWSPDGLRLAYLTVAPDRDFLDASAPTRLYVGTSEGFDGVYITSGILDRTQRLTWSPDGTRIAFASFDGARSDINVIYASGGDWIRISDGRNPVWRPNVIDVNRPISTVCAIAPVRIFATAFERQPGAKDRIGCPTADIVSVDGAMQDFDGGFMYWRNLPTGATVWVFLANGTWTQGDASRGPLLVPAPIGGQVPVSPPPGRGFPRNAFLGVWQSMGGPASSLGWAVGTEANFPSDGQSYERGLAFGGNNRVIFVNINGTYEVVPVS